jgi:lipopolysaccharide/colanic/teichoic acid biosynthesis glycosyltransferase
MATVRECAAFERSKNGLRAQLLVKHTLDRILALVLLVLLLPVLLVVSVAVLLSLGRPILFRQVRVGRGGRLFTMLKFRTMEHGPEFILVDHGIEYGPGGADGSGHNTAVGRWLRSTSLDELPQFWNVVKGEMSLVGPRPEQPEYVAIFEREVHGYRDRHRLNVGVTGLAQVSGLYGRTSIAARAACDNSYIDDFSLWLDLRILLRTFGTVLRRARERVE